MPVVAAREGWSLRGGQSPAAAGSAARGRQVVSSCRWSLLGRGGRRGLARALMTRVRRRGGDGLPLHAGGRCSGGVVTQGRPEPSCCLFSSHRETACLSVPVVAARCLSMPVVAAREGWLLRGGQSPPAAGSLARGRRVASACRWLLLGRGGRRREARAPLLRVHGAGGDALPLRAGGRCSGGVVAKGSPAPSCCGDGSPRWCVPMGWGDGESCLVSGRSLIPYPYWNLVDLVMRVNNQSTRHLATLVSATPALAKSLYIDNQSTG